MWNICGRPGSYLVEHNSRWHDYLLGSQGAVSGYSLGAKPHHRRGKLFIAAPVKTTFSIMNLTSKCVAHTSAGMVKNFRTLLWERLKSLKHQTAITANFLFCFPFPFKIFLGFRSGENAFNFLNFFWKSQWGFLRDWFRRLRFFQRVTATCCRTLV